MWFCFSGGDIFFFSNSYQSHKKLCRTDGGLISKADLKLYRKIQGLRCWVFFLIFLLFNSYCALKRNVWDKQSKFKNMSSNWSSIFSNKESSSEENAGRKVEDFCYFHTSLGYFKKVCVRYNTRNKPDNE